MDNLEDLIERHKELEKDQERLENKRMVVSFMLIVSMAMVIAAIAGPRELAIVISIILFILATYNLSL